VICGGVGDKEAANRYGFTFEFEILNGNVLPGEGMTEGLISFFDKMAGAEFFRVIGRDDSWKAEKLSVILCNPASCKDYSYEQNIANEF
jgi:hypothetical protein